MRRRQPVLLVAVAVLAVAVAPGTARAGEGQPHGAATADGPVVAQTDPFTHDAAGLAPGQIELVSLSARPDLVSGDAVRVAVRGLAATDPLTLLVDGRPSTAAIVPTASRPGQAAGSREAVLRGLTPGAHTISAVSAGRTATLVVTAHDPQASLLTGTHQEPFVCETAASGLPAATGPDCTVPTEVHWWYEDTAGLFQQLADPTAAYPADTATTTVDGRTVPFVVRVENVVLNRSITRIAVLDDPHGRGAAPFTAAEWNHDLLYHFGEACGTGFQQGTQAESDVFGAATSLSTSNIAGPFLAIPQRLGEGWMVVQSSLTIFGVACNQVLSAETLMDIEQHVWTEYGDLDHVVSGGGSGGAIQQLTIANQYPGLLSAITPILEFPDVETTAMTVHDCVLLNDLFTADRTRWTPDKILAVTGFPSVTSCADWASEIGPDLYPSSCPAGVPDPWSTTNPDGTRCTLQDDLKNILGVDAAGDPLRPLSNVGVEYGLKAYESGAISAADFVALNQQIGGLDLNGAHTAARTAMDPAAAYRAYADGLMDGRGALDEVPIIDQILLQAQETPEVDIHDADRPFQTRARLDATYGTHGNQVIWDFTSLPETAITSANSWLDDLDALQAQHPDLSRQQLVLDSRPADDTDRCEVGTTGVVDGLCDTALIRTSPRQVAGGPAAEDDIDCQLTPLTPVAGLSAAQQSELAAVFPSGVCDYAKPSIGKVTARSATWVSYGAGSTLAQPVVVGYPLARSAVPVTAAAPARTASGELAFTGLPAGLPVVAVVLTGAGVALRRRVSRRDTAASRPSTRH